MPRKKSHVVLGILIAVLVCLIGGFGAGGVTAHARNIEVSGLGENNATITDSNGKTIPNGSELSKWDNYELLYQWGIPDGVTIQDGDTATVNLPQSAVGRKDLSFPLYDDNGQKIGMFSIKEGATTGTITFNDVLSSTATNRGGHLQFYVKGTQENANVGLDWGINKIGWVSGHNPDGSPSRLTWNIAFNPNSTHLGQTVVTDNLGPGQSYIPGSVYAQTGKYDTNGSFVSDGNTITPTVDASNNTIIFTFDDVTTAVNMTYHTKPEISGTSGLWKNNATLNGQNVGSSIAWGGTGSGNGGGNTADEQVGKVILTKTDAATGKALAGAVYELRDANGQILQTGLTTDDQGALTVENLAAGHYQFVETKAPEGYALNPAPISFEITADSTAAVAVSATDTALTGGGTGPENPGTTTPPVTNPENPENPGTTTPPTTNPETPENPENPENPEHPGTTPPTTPTNPENPGTTIPTHPENPGTTTPSVKPPKPTKPNKPSQPAATHKPGAGQTTSNVTNGGASGHMTGQTNGTSQPATNAAGAGNAATSNAGSGASTTTAPSHQATSGATLPQTGEYHTSNLILTIIGVILLVLTLGFWYRERRQ